ncbi:flavin reductase family protein [Streptomyces sp. NPDC049577]|uniref:flavin reductase family protein n=1 Tax=Streptomyces sp. NPDC049577 TaxID=3155153 RepID=UPI003444402D
MIQQVLTAEPAVTPEDYRHVISGLPTGITVITARSADGPVGCTASAVMSLSCDPPSLLVSLTTGSRTLAGILAAGAFAVNVLAWSDRALTRRFATGTAAERFAGVPWDSVHGVPVLTRAAVSVVCTVGETVPLLDHTLVAGMVTWAQSNDSAPSVLCRNQHYAVGG